jgi:carboxymethylenebutenolidase
LPTQRPSSPNRGSAAAAGPKDAETPPRRSLSDRRQLRRQGRTLHGATDRLERASTTNGVEHDAKQYPGAGHAFLNDHRDPLSRLVRIVHIEYHEPSAKDARQRIVSFVNARLKRQDLASTEAHPGAAGADD